VAGLTLDAGALIAYERGAPRVREILATAFARGLVPTIPSVALAEVWRGDGKDARIARLLKVSSVEPLDELRARDAGALRRRVPGAGTIDACVAVGAAQRGDAVATSDPHDLRQLLGSSATILTV
jgi:predicted nucleic acid-binding protein